MFLINTRHHEISVNRFRGPSVDRGKHCVVPRVSGKAHLHPELRELLPPAKVLTCPGWVKGWEGGWGWGRHSPPALQGPLRPGKTSPSGWTNNPAFTPIGFIETLLFILGGNSLKERTLLIQMPTANPSAADFTARILCYETLAHLYSKRCEGCLETNRGNPKICSWEGQLSKLLMVGQYNGVLGSCKKETSGVTSCPWCIGEMGGRGGRRDVKEKRIKSFSLSYFGVGIYWHLL